MDERDGSPIHSDITQSAERNSAAARRDPQDASIVYCGSAERVREGFAIALGLMGITAAPSDVVRTSRPNQELGRSTRGEAHDHQD